MDTDNFLSLLYISVLAMRLHPRQAQSEADIDEAIRFAAETVKRHALYHQQSEDFKNANL
jgi:hypothetical protein